MKILIIVKDIGGNAAGIIFSNYINALLVYDDIEITVLTNGQSIVNDQITKHYIVPNKKECSNRVIKLFVLLLKLNLNNFFWKKAVKKVLKNNKYIDKFDLIISFVSGSTEATANIGVYASKLFRAKLYIHMVDPIPPPKGWEIYELYRKNLFFGIKKPLEFCDLVSLSNDTMTAYQIALLGKEKKHFTLPNPVLAKCVKQVKRMKSDNFFNYVFLGSAVTGARTPYKLFMAFEKISTDYPDSKIYFFGHSPRLDLNQIPEAIKSKIIFKNYTSDLDEAYSIADVFIDIDGDLEYDVFISSKLQLYLSINRPILSITGPNSPTRSLLKTMNKSTLITSFDLQELAKGLIDVRSIKVNKGFYEERNAFLEKNQLSVFTNLLCNKLQEIVI